jgi:hypothetical protein
MPPKPMGTLEIAETVRGSTGSVKSPFASGVTVPR